MMGMLIAAAFLITILFLQLLFFLFLCHIVGLHFFAFSLAVTVFDFLTSRLFQGEEGEKRDADEDDNGNGNDIRKIR